MAMLNYQRVSPQKETKTSRFYLQGADGLECDLITEPGLEMFNLPIGVVDRLK